MIGGSKINRLQRKRKLRQLMESEKNVNVGETKVEFAETVVEQDKSLVISNGKFEEKMKVRYRWLLGVLLLTPCLLGVSGGNVNSNLLHPNNIEKVQNQFIVKNQQVVQNNPPNILPHLSIPSDAVQIALLDAAEVRKKNELDLSFTRWIWVQSGEANDFKAISDSINKISRGPRIVKPIVSGSGILARIDLRWYVLDDKDVVDWISYWEHLQFDPWFSLLLTKDTLKLLSTEFKENTTVSVKKTKWVQNEKKEWIENGFKIEEVKIVDLKDVNVIRLNAEHLRKSNIEQLQLACGTVVPIVDSRYFLARVLSTIKDKDNNKDNLFSVVWGGLYYEFTGIRPANKGVKTDLDQLLFDLGVGSKDETFTKLFDRLGAGDEAAVMFRSGITGKRRRIHWFGHEKNRLSASVPAVFLTEDIRDRDVDIGADPILNLLDSRIAAYEVIYTKLNGLQGYALFNGDGKLLEEAASDVAADHRVPSPHTPRLQSGISCIRCHGEHDGWIPFKNDLNVMIKDRFDIYGDTSKSELNKPTFETVNRLAGLYGGDPTELMFRLRNDYMKAVLRSTGNWKDDGAQTNTVKLSSAQIAKVWAQDRYDQVDAGLALKYLGFPAPDAGREVEALNKIVPPVSLNIGGIIPEDPRIHALKRGLKINPVDFGLVYNFVLSRANQQRDQLKVKVDSK